MIKYFCLYIMNKKVVGAVQYGQHKLNFHLDHPRFVKAFRHGTTYRPYVHHRQAEELLILVEAQMPLLFDLL
jgi:hypothetical protein